MAEGEPCEVNKEKGGSIYLKHSISHLTCLMLKTQLLKNFIATYPHRRVLSNFSKDGLLKVVAIE